MLAAGAATHAAAKTTTTGATNQWLADRRRLLPDDVCDPVLVHRADRDSGIDRLVYLAYFGGVRPVRQLGALLTRHVDPLQFSRAASGAAIAAAMAACPAAVGCRPSLVQVPIAMNWPLATVDGTTTPVGMVNVVELVTASITP